jgi:hypothetical protein
MVTGVPADTVLLGENPMVTVGLGAAKAHAAMANTPADMPANLFAVLKIEVSLVIFSNLLVSCPGACAPHVLNFLTPCERQQDTDVPSFP